MTVAEMHVEIAQRLLANCQAERGDLCDAPMKLPVSSYRDPSRWEAEMERLFRRSPLVVALSCDVPGPGDYVALDIADRPILVVRGDDGAARTFLNVCRHRGARLAPAGCGHARRFTCPYHAWSYDPAGRLVGVPGRESFAELDVAGLMELPTAERAGLVLATLTPGQRLDADTWLGGMAEALEPFRLAELHRYEVSTELDGPNWKLVADGYVDGYHIGYLHKRSIGANAVTNRNTYDLFGPHQRIGFADKALLELADLPLERWPPRLHKAMSLVHFLFPNVSIAGNPGGAILVSWLLPGPTPERSRTVQVHYLQAPVRSDEERAKVEARRELFRRVVAEEDYATAFGIGAALDAVADGHFRFGRNEVGNQHLHRSIDALVGNAGPG